MKILIPSRIKIVRVLVDKHDFDRQLLPIALCLFVLLLPLLYGAGGFALKVVHFRNVFKVSPFDPYAKAVVVSSEAQACSFADYWREKAAWMDRGLYRDSEVNRANHELERSFSERCSEMGELGVEFEMLTRMGPGDYRVRLDY